MTASMRRAVRAGEQRGGRIAAFGDHRLIAGLAHHVVEKPAGDGIVIDDQNTLTHVRNLCTQLYATRTQLGESIPQGHTRIRSPSLAVTVFRYGSV